MMYRARGYAGMGPPAPAVSAGAAVGTERWGAAFYAFCVLTFVLVGRPQDYVLSLVPLRLALVMTVITVVLTFLRDSPTQGEPILASRETKLYLAFYVALVCGIPFSVYRPGSFDAVITRYVVNIAFFLLFLVHVDSVAKLKRIGALLVVAIFIFTLVGLRQGSFIGGRYDTGSTVYDPNDVAFVEVSLMAFALWVLVGSFGVLTKIMALASVLCGILLILFTASRGGLLGLITFLVLFMFLRVSKVRGRFKFVMLLALVAIAAANADKINVDRYRTLELGSVENDYNFQAGGRTDIWERGVTLFLRSPITGVGVDGFGKAIGDMRAAEQGVLPKWQTAHSSYVLVLTETGVLGTVPFLLLILVSLWTFNRLRRKRDTIHDPDLAALPGLLLMGFGAQLVAAAFLSQTYSTFFTLAFACSATMGRLARRDAKAGAPVVPAPLPAQQPYAHLRLNPARR